MKDWFYKWLDWIWIPIGMWIVMLLTPHWLHSQWKFVIPVSIVNALVSNPIANWFRCKYYSGKYVR